MSTTSTSLVQSSPHTVATRSTPKGPSAPTTPTAKSVTAHAIEAKPSPGTFRHPNLTEVIRRQSKTTLTERNIRTAVINVAVLTLSFAFSQNIYQTFDFLLRRTPLTSTSDITFFGLAALRILFLANTLLSLSPILTNTPTTYDDIPLTPSQRQLLGLPPSTTSTAGPTPGTPSTTFITPPRYTRRLSSTSTSSPSTDRRSISANYSSSPLSTSRHTVGFSPTPNASTSTYRRTASGSPFSPSGSLAGSPLFHKAVQNRERSDRSVPDLNFDVSSRTSLASSISPLARSQSVRERGSSISNSSRSPARRREDGERGDARSPAQKGVNYKWLYDKGFGGGGRASGGLSRSESMGF